MHFRPESVSTFLALFANVHPQISNFEGCTGVTLLRDINTPGIFFTYSHWQSPTHLEAYRHSELFRNTWSQTKSFFAEKAEAWSVEEARDGLE
jgi:quinol monooxygenase YgiN